jgi:hypothetical protein
VDQESLLTRLAELENRLRRVEDHTEIQHVIASYGPAADSVSGDEVAALWANGGTYELQGWFFTSETMHETVESELHHRYVAAGSAHVMTLPMITVDGDRAVVLNYSTVFVHDGERWVADRVAANRWDLERTSVGWRVRRRVNRLLDGNPDARALLAGEVPPPPTT